MNNREWSNRLAEAYEKKTGRKRGGIRLPERAISFAGERDVTITMTEPAILENMQKDHAAFEAWSLALKIWCEVESVELKWAPPTNPRSDTSEWCNYQRFLYRADRFASLFPWFKLGLPVRDLGAAFGPGPYFLNVPGDRSKLDENPTRIEDDDPPRESDVEKRLRLSSEFKEHFGLKKVDRQLPVGLFHEKVARDKRIFTGGKSAIDLAGIGEDALWLFELKVGGNSPAGILSELLFYTSVLRDAIPAPARFRFDPSKTRGQNLSSGDIVQCTRIESVFLGEQFHPLIGNSETLECLNKSVEERWNREIGHVPVHFRATFLKRSAGKPYGFEDL